MTRPGAPLAPVGVWHELQSPEVSEPIIGRVPFDDVTFTKNGAAIEAFDPKLPTLLTGIVTRA